MSKRNSQIHKDASSVVNVKKVHKVFDAVGQIFNDNNMNFAESLKVLHEMTLATFQARIDGTEDYDKEIKAFLEIADEYLLTLADGISFALEKRDKQ